ncbi:MAG TPA: benzoyl-CoA reductase subunit D [Vicinamibacterales bacterium]|nr:benzoyl-CoA reductase subunit D [Vicinamibacterales bacterium]
MVTTAGVDVGSSSIKVAVVRSRAGEDATVLARGWQRIRRRNVHDLTRAGVDDCCAAAGTRVEDLDYLASTGDGDAVPFRTGHFYSMTTHARGALHLDGEARAVLDVGALHARAIRIDHRGKVLAHRMTSQCASGTGQFLENIARYLGVALEDVGSLSRAAGRAEAVSSICAVLAETDVINMVSRGIAAPEILRGIHESIAGRLVRLVRAAGADGVVLVSGGLAKDEGLLCRIEEQINRLDAGGSARLTVRTHPDAIFAGALGAALLAARRHAQLAAMGRFSAGANQSIGSSGNTSAVTSSGTKRGSSDDSRPATDSTVQPPG